MNAMMKPAHNTKEYIGGEFIAERTGGHMTDSGYLSSYKILLNVQCVKCRVWVGTRPSLGMIEFDGMPHRCTPKQWVREPLT